MILLKEISKVQFVQKNIFEQIFLFFMENIDINMITFLIFSFLIKVFANYVISHRKVQILLSQLPI